MLDGHVLVLNRVFQAVQITSVRRALILVGVLVGVRSKAPRPKFEFRWEALFRYDSIYHLRVRPDIERGRFEFRPEVAFEPSDRWKIAVRAVGNIGTDDNSQNARNFDNYRSDGASL